MKWNDIQKEIKVWSETNFGVRPEWHPLLGLFEEQGELAHAYLKKAQGIRGTPEQHDADMQDAVGDMVIYLLDFANAMGFDVNGFKKGNLGRAPGHRLLFRVLRAVAVLETKYCFGKADELPITASLILLQLDRFCEAFGWNFGTIVMDTWHKVKQRDWKKEPNGPAAEKNYAQA